MSFYTIPLFISFDSFLQFVSRFSEYSFYSSFINSDFIFPTWLFVNFIYLWFIFGVLVPFMYRGIMIIKTSLFR